MDRDELIQAIAKEILESGGALRAAEKIADLVLEEAAKVAAARPNGAIGGHIAGQILALTSKGKPND